VFPSIVSQILRTNICSSLFLSFRSKFDTLIQAQARELSHFRQRLREGRGVCSILTQHLGDTTKAFEELLRANDIDYYMGQSFRDQLAQGGALAQRVSAKISGRECFTSAQILRGSYWHEIHLLLLYLHQEINLKIQMRRPSCSPSGQWTHTRVCVCVCVCVAWKVLVTLVLHAQSIMSDDFTQWFMRVPTG